MLKAWQYVVKLWHLRKMDESYLQDLLESKGVKDSIADEMAKRVLFEMRVMQAWQPYRELKKYFRVFKLIKEIMNGRYRKPRSQDNSDPNAASSGSPGAGGVPVAQFTFTNPNAGFTGFATAGASGLNQIGVVPPLPNPAPFFEDAGIVAGEVVAYRGWRLRDGLLTSMFQNEVVWTPGEIMEGDASRGDGVHAFKSVILLAQYGNGYSSSGDIVVTGTVWLWGEVYEHERGYRASKAAIRSIDDSHEYDAKVLRKRYGLSKRRKRPVDKDVDPV